MRAECDIEVLPDLAQSLGADQLGYLPKDKQTGKFADEWSNALVFPFFLAAKWRKR